MKRTTISLPDDLAALVEEEARRRSTSVSEVIRSAVTSALVGTERREIPFAAICDDPDLAPGAAIDAALAETWAEDLARRRR